MFPSRDLPVALDLQYASAGGQQPVLTITIEVKIDALTFASQDGKEKAVVDLAGFVYDARGKPGSSFQQQVTVTPATTDEPRRQGEGVVYKHRVSLKPGLYQVRGGARDQKSGRAGSTNEWIEIPDLTTRRLAVSTITLREAAATNGPALESLTSRGLVNHRFARDSAIRFDGHIYNATGGENSKPDVAVQLQILRDRQPVVTTPLQRVPDNQSPAALGFGGNLSLQRLPAGRYVLIVTAIDRVSKTSASQQTRFEIN
jgi:hypothetical protein